MLVEIPQYSQCLEYSIIGSVISDVHQSNLRDRVMKLSPYTFVLYPTPILKCVMEPMRCLLYIETTPT